MHRIIVVLMLAITSACSAEKVGSAAEIKEFSILGVTYTVPQSDILGIVDNVRGMAYLSVRPKGQTFDLIADETALLGINYQNGDVPIIRDINSHPAPEFETFIFKGGKTVCRNDTPYLNCGLAVQDGDVPWAVLFNRTELKESESIRLKAKRIIAGYRG